MCPDCREFEKFNKKLIENKSLEEMSAMELLFKVHDMQLERKTEGIFHRDGLITIIQESIQRQKELFPQVVTLTTGTEKKGGVNWNDQKGNIMFHFNPRPSQNQIVMNTKEAFWGIEERIPLPQGDGPLTFTIYVTKEGYLVTKDDVLLHVYSHRIPFEDFTSIESDDNSWTVIIKDKKDNENETESSGNDADIDTIKKLLGGRLGHNGLMICQCGHGLGACMIIVIILLSLLILISSIIIIIIIIRCISFR